jgi:pilus assembly protein CpaE
VSTQDVLLVGPLDAGGLAERLGRSVACHALPHAPRPGEPLGPRPDAAVVAVDPDPAASFALVTRLTGEGVKVVVVGPVKDADLILRAMRAGAVEFALAGDVDHLIQAVRGLLRRPTGETRQGAVVTLFSPKGGVGATTLAVNLAGALEKRGERTCLLDLDLEMGDALAFLDLPGSYGVSDVIANLHRLDRDLLDASLPVHRSGVRVLAQSAKIEDAGAVDASSLGRLIDFLRGHYDRVVVDGLRGFGELQLAGLDASQHILLVVTQEIPALRNARRCVDLFRRLGYGDDRLRLVVNRHQRRARIPDDLLAETAGLPISARVGNDYQLVDRSIHAGSLVVDEAGRSPLGRDLSALVELLGEPAQSPARTGSLLRRVFAGKAVPHGA